MKKLLAILVLSLVCVFCAMGFAACDENATGGQDAQILGIYNTYVAYAEENGETPLSYEEWIKSIKGENGKDGKDGINGIDGKDGVSIVKIEKTSTDGLIDTYTITYSNGETTTFTVKNGVDGQDGTNGIDGQDGINGIDGNDGKDGINGKSAYEIWLDNGNTGTQSDFLTWLKGENGANGTDGKDGKNGVDGQDGANGVDGKDGKDGINGKSAYEIWLDNGNTGTQSDFLVWLKGENGTDGKDGQNGKDGANGVNGKDGKDGVNGTNGTDGVGIKNATIDNNGNLIITLTDGNMINAGKVKDVHGHETVEREIVGKEPTCISVGVKYLVCEECGEILKTVAIPKTSHNYVDGLCKYCGKIEPISTEGVIFTLNEECSEYSVTGYNGIDTEVIIGYEYNGLPVTSIGERAFSGANITKIIIPDSIKIIGQYAFHSCKGLTSVTIGNGVTSIGYFAFAGTGITSIVIPSSVSNIGSYSFGYCSWLSSVTICDGVNSIENSAFTGCFNLKSITIPNSVIFMGTAVFLNCSALTSVTIGSGVTSIGYNVFYYCDSLTSIVIPNSVTSIVNSAFGYCTKLKTIYYKGSESEFEQITVGDGNSAFTDAMVYYYSATEPAASGNFWHYDTDGVTPVIWSK